MGRSGVDFKNVGWIIEEATEHFDNETSGLFLVQIFCGNKTHLYLSERNPSNDTDGARSQLK